MSIKSIKSLLTLLVAGLLLAACSTPTPPTKNIEVQFVGWVIENMPADFSSNASARLSTGILFAEPELEQDKLVASDFKSVTVTSPTGGQWTFDDPEVFVDRFSEENRHLFIGKLISTDNDGASYVELGNYDIDIVLKDGANVSSTLFVPAPGSKDLNGAKNAYTENFTYADAPPTDFVPTIKRAVGTSAVLGDTLDITFSTQDSLAYSGWIWLYNADGDFVGYSEAFRSFEDGAMLSALNAGEAYYTDGTPNVLSLDFGSEAITLVDEFTSADIAYARITLTDGYQYADEQASYDAKSMSERIFVSRP